MLLVPQRQESPYTTRRSLLAAKGGSPDLSPSPEAASHPFKRKDKGIRGEKPAIVLNLGSSYSGCCLSRRAQFGVVVLQVFLESSCSKVFGVVVLQCELYSRQESPYTTRRSLLAAKGGSPDLSPSPEAASHPFKRKDKGIRGEKPAVLGKGADPTEEAQVFLESLCSKVFEVVVLQCELYSRF
ncbi:hypothetical protein Taro_007667 [Colocasia esculenta]|uniref:Uncharacterized protein n=1 Tax=Colocasia esculenta TaxID=4460 RepID=A0A843TYV6_COLES|nr:hypothetical protein [Colocasia esculenta]